VDLSGLQQTNASESLEEKNQLRFLAEPAVLDAVNTTGGVLILAIGINLLKIGHIPVSNLLPALVYAIISALML
jgi:hypothetical protein